MGLFGGFLLGELVDSVSVSVYQKITIAFDFDLLALFGYSLGVFGFVLLGELVD